MAVIIASFSSALSDGLSNRFFSISIAFWCSIALMQIVYHNDRLVMKELSDIGVVNRLYTIVNSGLMSCRFVPSYKEVISLSCYI